jgi:type IV secretory pathway VirB6-like protein
MTKKVTNLAVIRYFICLFTFLSLSRLVYAKECRLAEDLGYSHNIQLENTKWFNTMIVLNHHNYNHNGYLRIQAHGRFVVGYSNTYAKTLYETARFASSYLIWGGNYLSENFFKTDIYGKKSAGLLPCQFDDCYLKNDPASCIVRGSIISDKSPKPCAINTDILPDCQLDDCYLKNDVNRCLARGSVISDHSPRPCALNDGDGVIGKFVSSNKNYSTQTPDTLVKHGNLREDKKASPNNPDNDKYFFLKAIPTTDISKHMTLHIKSHLQSEGIVIPENGQLVLHLKVLDSLPPTRGKYNLSIINESKVKTFSIFSELLEAFDKTLQLSANKIIDSILIDGSFHRIFSSLSLLYVAISGLSFSMGLIPHRRDIMIQRLFKLVIICTITSPLVAMNCIETAKLIFIDSSSAIANTILKAMKQDNGPYNESIYFNLSLISFYDQLVYFCLSLGLHAKIWSLIFSKYCFYIPIIYVGMGILILACIRGLSIYIATMIILVILITISPIMMCMIFFKITQNLFVSWFKSIFSFAFLNILTCMALGLFSIILYDYNFSPFYFTVCKLPLNISEYLSRYITIDVWKPLVEVDINQISVVKIHSFFIYALVFYKMSEILPILVQSVSPAFTRQVNYLIPFVNKVQSYSTMPIGFIGKYGVNIIRGGGQPSGRISRGR